MHFLTKPNHINRHKSSLKTMYTKTNLDRHICPPLTLILIRGRGLNPHPVYLLYKFSKKKIHLFLIYKFDINFNYKKFNYFKKFVYLKMHVNLEINRIKELHSFLNYKILKYIFDCKLMR